MDAVNEPRGPKIGMSIPRYLIVVSSWTLNRSIACTAETNIMMFLFKHSTNVNWALERTYMKHRE